MIGSARLQLKFSGNAACEILAMCDYSLQSIRSRAAKVGDKLVTKGFGTGTRGFASVTDPTTAVCVLPGTELACCGPSTRRDFLATMSVLGLQMAAVSAAIPAAAEPASERPKEGDFLVAVESTSAKSALEPQDIPPDAAPMFAWPMDPAGNLVRDGSRLNKVLVLRLDPVTLVGDTRNRAADGILAYSAICPHAGCDVAVWRADAKLLECPCHASHFNPRQAGALIDGPAPRDLPALPLKIADGKLVVAKPFTSRPGFIQG